MNKNIIEFSSDKNYIDLKKNFPKPIKLNIPKWFKNLEHNADTPTIKGCIPFLDSLITGYVLELPQDFYLKINFLDQNEYKLQIKPSLEQSRFNLNTQELMQSHPKSQIKGSSKIKKNLNFPIFKILNPWAIKTPPGYSCLFVPPLNNKDDRFEIISGIVNTDEYKDQINFPIIFNGDKYPVQDTILKQGTPYVQVIPFKRSSWEMSIKEKKNTDRDFNHTSKILHIYKNLFWKKISWK
jgi:hypothetical protein